MLSRCVFSKISACELSRKFIKSALVVGFEALSSGAGVWSGSPRSPSPPPSFSLSLAPTTQTSLSPPLLIVSKQDLPFSSDRATPFPPPPPFLFADILVRENGNLVSTNQESCRTKEKKKGKERGFLI